MGDETDIAPLVVEDDIAGVAMYQPEIGNYWGHEQDDGEDSHRRRCRGDESHAGQADSLSVGLSPDLVSAEATRLPS